MRIGRILAVSLGAASIVLSCGGGERTIVKTFFDAVQGGDADAAARVSVVEFPDEVSSWEIVEVGPEFAEPFPLDTMHKKFLELEDEVETKKSADQTFLEANLEVYQEYRKRTENNPDAELEGKLAEFKSELDTRLAAQDELEKALEKLREEMKQLREAATLSLNTAVNERYSGEVKGKELHLNVNGKSYRLVLKRYELVDSERNITPISRWIITGIEEQKA